MARGRLPRGVRLVALYKLAKGILQAGAAITLSVLLWTGSAERAYELAAELRDHLVQPWAIRAAEILTHWLTAARLWWLVAALGGDALVSAVEAWALARGYEWAQWFVIAATSLLLPVEIIELAQHLTVGRVLLFLINFAIVYYLLKHEMRLHHLRHPHHGRHRRHFPQR